MTNQEKGNDDSDIIQLTRGELKLILEHAGVVLCKNEIRKEEIRLENESFRRKFFNFAPIHIIFLFALSISIISLLLVAINGNGLENTESSKYYSMLFVLGLATIVFLFTLYNIIGAILWIIPLTLIGYLFGNLPFVKNNFTIVILCIIVISAMPLFIGILNRKRLIKKSNF